ncbi:response regulator [Arenibaculum pallidiluteum]|uniref:response regulator n=1 Tax=Arenibaculum pallidiluteum TaxID=2812559 RepID=UPI001A9600F9|nr:response regulator [Arenibaculum pallidiluteum]
MRVLIVEDDVVVALAFRLAMESLGFEVCGTAPSERTALMLLDEVAPDFLTVDVRLQAGDDGMRVAEVAWNRHGLRSLLITGDPAAVDAGRAARMRVLGSLSKPIGFIQLRTTLENVRATLSGPVAPLPPHFAMRHTSAHA